MATSLDPEFPCALYVDLRFCLPVNRKLTVSQDDRPAPPHSSSCVRRAPSTTSRQGTFPPRPPIILYHHTFHGLPRKCETKRREHPENRIQGYNEPHAAGCGQWVYGELECGVGDYGGAGCGCPWSGGGQGVNAMKSASHGRDIIRRIADIIGKLLCARRMHLGKKRLGSHVLENIYGSSDQTIAPCPGRSGTPRSRTCSRSCSVHSGLGTSDLGESKGVFGTDWLRAHARDAMNRSRSNDEMHIYYTYSQADLPAQP